MTSKPAGWRVSVVGTTGSGKTTLARHLAKRFAIPHVELDALHWGPDWTAVPLPIFRARVTNAVKGDQWVADGNYSKVRDIVWSRARTVVWLDYSLLVILLRLTSRTLLRSARQEELWHGNRESLRQALLSRQSIILWGLRTYGRRRREYPAHFEKPEYAHLKVVHLRSPRAARAWLQDQEASQVSSASRTERRGGQRVCDDH